jgi:hypothetical protein
VPEKYSDHGGAAHYRDLDPHIVHKTSEKGELKIIKRILIGRSKQKQSRADLSSTPQST